ncbi:MAG: adenylosuccinate lyase [Thermoplasmata archaeon]|nr:adenylosuccinate lyase [Thermoplasmata archaeon]
MSSSGGALFCPLEFRYGRPELRALFSRERRLERALRVEAALARSVAEVGLIPEEAAAGIEAAATSGAVRIERVDALEAELRHDVMAIALALGEAAGPAGAWVHFGATSADITDTALGLEHREAAGALREDLTELVRALAEVAQRHRASAEVGRTHGQYAVPTSFGYKVVGFAAEFLRHRQRLDQLLPRLAVGKMAGAVGTGGSFGPHAAEVERRVMAQLGLHADEAPSQVIGRDRIAEFTNLLALVAGTSERLATEFRNLQRSEIAELQEPFDEARQVGSSTMAQKRNPMVSENVTSLARLVRAFALPPLENMVLWHERDLANSANERVVIPHSVLLTDDILRKLTTVVRGLEVRTGRMEEILESTGGSTMTESLMLGLTAKRVPRAEAHELLRALTRRGDAGGSLLERARRDPKVRAHLTEAEITALLDPAAYVRAAAAKTDRVLAWVHEELAS